MDRTALLIQCSREEARTIRWRAKQERRTISGYVLNLLDLTLKFEEDLFQRLPNFEYLNPALKKMARRGPGLRTAVLIRCSAAEAARIRLGAKRRQITISGFVVLSLRRAWNVKTRGKISLA